MASQPAAVQRIPQRVRSGIREALPVAEEAISYQIPTYKLEGRAVLYFDGWKQHYSLYPASDELVAAFGGELEKYRASKGTLRFPLSVPVPVKLIERIARYRLKEMGERKRAKAAPPKKR